jgi:hypothetical protein
MAKRATKRIEDHEGGKVIQLPVPLLTRPVAVSGGKGVAKVELHGHERVVDRIVEITKQQDNLETELKILREPVQGAAKAARDRAEIATGKTIKTVVVHGTEHPANFNWKNVYRTTDASHEPALRACLGPYFDTLFEATFNLKFRDNSPVGRRNAVNILSEALGERFEAIFEAVPEVAARGELMEKRTALRAALTVPQNTALDQILDQIQANPSLSVK